MNKTKDVLDFIKERRDRKINGIKTNFDKFSEILPAWDINSYIIFAGRTGEGKSSFVWAHAVLDVIMFLKDHPEVKSHIYYFSLELNHKELYMKVFASLLFKKFKKRYSRDIFMGVTDERLTDEEIEFLEKEAKPITDLIDKYVTIYDANLTPTEAAVELFEKIDNSDLEYPFVIMDTVNAVSYESGSTKQEAMKLWNQEIALKELRNTRNCIVINIMQLDNESGKRQYNINGANIAEKYIPNLESIGNDKESSRSASLVLSLFDPASFDLKIVEGYDVTKFQGSLRFLYVLKSSFGEKSRKPYPFVYQGVTNTWKEILHTPNEFRNDPSLYLLYGIDPSQVSSEDNKSNSILGKYSTK